ncbi:GNAT family N-acetyltransferase [uncultured Sphingomonas sp.]|uniref:GNAT family N-acetyltransferase n=1 Tax=uncultured Sphingomonas sp. TaxID=158754 RepID=UPI0035CB39E2
MIRPAHPDDAGAIAGIYAPYVTGGIATFELIPAGAAEIARRMASSDGRLPWLVWEDADRVTGYAYASPFNARAAYRWTVETTVYLAAAAHGQGVGRRLYEALLTMLTAQGFAQAVALVSRPNPASERLHERLGFRLAGTIERAGCKHGAWIDVGYWQRALADPGDPPAEPRVIASDP